MRAVRGLLVAAGVACGLWGLWLMRDFTGEQLRSTGLWLAGAVVVHDLVVAPVVVVLGVVAARLLPGRFRAPAATAFLVWATLSVTFLPVLSGEGGKPGNDTILGRPYLLSWVVMTVLLAGVAVVSGMRRSRRDRAS
ncbi:MAG: hypothetical protein ABWY50_06745 [Aeromicrobium sp.]